MPKKPAKKPRTRNKKKASSATRPTPPKLGLRLIAYHLAGELVLIDEYDDHYDVFFGDDAAAELEADEIGSAAFALAGEYAVQTHRMDDLVDGTDYIREHVEAYEEWEKQQQRNYSSKAVSDDGFNKVSEMVHEILNACWERVTEVAQRIVELNRIPTPGELPKLME